MGIRVSKEEKLKYVQQVLVDVYFHLNKNFNKFIEDDICFSTSGNSLYDVVLSSTFTPLKSPLLVDLNFDVYRKGTNTLVHRLTLSEEMVSSSTQVNGINIGFAPIFKGFSVPCYRGKPQGQYVKKIDVTEVKDSDVLNLMSAIQKSEVFDALYRGLPKLTLDFHKFLEVR